MRSLEELQAALRYMNIKSVAKEIGVHPETLYRFARGAATPTYHTLRALDDWLTGLANGAGK